MSFLNSLGRTVRHLDLPFGYTLTVWSCGVVAIDSFGFPSLLEALVFLVGAIGAYLSCAAVAYRHLRETVDTHPHVITVLNAFSVVAAVVVSVVSRLSPNPAVGYLIAGFVGTLTYILSFSALAYGGDILRGHR